MRHFRRPLSPTLSPLLQGEGAPLLILACALASCSGPRQHLETRAEEAAAPRATVATTLDAPSPLDAAPCGLPTLPERPCPAAASESGGHEHHHHHGGGEEETVVDPVCNMRIKPASARGGSLTLDGKKVFFCSTSCRTTFAKQHPEAK